MCDEVKSPLRVYKDALIKAMDIRDKAISSARQAYIEAEERAHKAYLKAEG